MLFEKTLAMIFSGNGWHVRHSGKANDKGADLLLFGSTGQQSPIFVVQAKNHSRPLTVDQVRSEIVKFEKEGIQEYKCRQFRLISLNGYVKKADKLLGDFKVTLESWHDITPLIENYKVNGRALPPIELNAHNKWAWEQTDGYFQVNRNLAFIQATGTGKSYLGLRAIQKYIGCKILYLAPTTPLLGQMKNQIPWLSDRFEVATYSQCLSEWKANTIDAHQDNWELIILDEFHRLGGEQWGAAIQELVRLNPKSMVIGLSATPIRFLDSQRDMVKELFNGSAIYGPDLFEAIVRGILPSPNYVSGFYRLDEEIEAVKSNILKSNHLTDEDRGQLLLQTQQQFERWNASHSPSKLIKKHADKLAGKHLIFCEDIGHLNSMESEVASWFKEAASLSGLKYTKVKTLVSHSELSAQHNNKALFDFSRSDIKEITLLFSVNKLNEGIHISNTASVFLLRKTMSPIIYYQQIGRCLMADQGYTPIIFDLVNNQKAISKKPMRVSLEKAAVRESKRRKSAGLDPKVEVQWDTHDESVSWMEHLELLSMQTNSWEYFYQELVEYRHLHGHSNVPQKENRLGKWINHQRYEFKSGQLSHSREDRLNAIEFVWDQRDEAWENNFIYLKSLTQALTRCPYKFGDKNIDEWMNSQRKFYRNNTIRQNRFERLESLGFVWNLWEYTWNEKYQRLKSFYHENKHSNIPRTAGTLGRWVQKQREDEHKLTYQQKALLNLLNFRWRSKNQMALSLPDLALATTSD